MLININMKSETPIYVQLRNQIVMGIGSGSLKIGQSLPTVRQMAEDLAVNTMTVSKAYTVLKNEGYIEIDRRHGAKISTLAGISKGFTEKMEQELALIISEASIKGISREDFFCLCSSAFDKLNITCLEDGAV